MGWCTNLSHEFEDWRKVHARSAPGRVEVDNVGLLGQEHLVVEVVLRQCGHFGRNERGDPLAQHFSVAHPVLIIPVAKFMGLVS